MHFHKLTAMLLVAVAISTAAPAPSTQSTGDLLKYRGTRSSGSGSHIENRWVNQVHCIKSGSGKNRTVSALYRSESERVNQDH